MAEDGFRRPLISKALCMIVVLLECLVLVSSKEPHSLNKMERDMMESVLNNQILVKYFVNCYLDLGPCSSQAEQLKQLFQENYKSKCSNCTEEEEASLKRFFSTFHSKYKGDYDKIVEKYDPNHEFSEDFEAWFTENENNTLE